MFLWHHSLSLTYELYVRLRNVLFKIFFSKIKFQFVTISSQLNHSAVLASNKRNLVGQHFTTECTVSI